MKHHLGTALKLAGLGVVAGHLGLTLAFNLPDNPLRQRLEPVLSATIGTYFPQNWRLFAPEPASSDVSIVVGCVDAPNVARLSASHAAGDPVAWDADWVDITAPLWTHHQQTRLSAYDRISRAQANAGRAFLQGPAGLESYWKACTNGETEICARLERANELFRSSQLRKMIRIASSYCAATSDETAGVALRVRERRAVPWSHRFSDAEPETSDVDLGVFPIDRSMDPSPIYARAGTTRS